MLNSEWSKFERKIVNKNKAIPGTPTGMPTDFIDQ